MNMQKWIVGIIPNPPGIEVLNHKTIDTVKKRKNSF